MTKQDVLAQMKLKKHERVMQHRAIIAMYGQTKGLTDSEWNNVEIRVKGSGTKGKGHANTRLWLYHNEGIKLQTKYKKPRII